MSPSHRAEDSSADPVGSPAPEPVHAPAAEPVDTVTGGAPLAGSDVNAASTPSAGGDRPDAAEDQPDPHEVRAKFLPTGKAVGRLRIQPRGESSPSSAKKARWWELPVLAIVAVAVAVIVKTFIVQPFYIPSGSMEKTLHGCGSCNGDKILVNKPIFDVRSPHPGDIIVFSRPDAWPRDLESPTPPKTNLITGPIRWFGQLVGVIPPDREDLVKRVIAVGGQTVKCCDAQGRVQVSDNGAAGPFRSLDEPYTFLDGGPEVAFGPVTVPHGRLWVMGDHRTDSADSRFHCEPNINNLPPGGQTCDPVSSTVPISHVIGKAFVIAWPPSRWRTLGTPHTFKAKALAGAAALTSGLPLAAGVLAVLPLWFWRRRTTSARAP